MLENSLLDSLSRKNQYKFPFLLLGLYLTFLLATVCLANKITLVGKLLVPGGIFVFVFTFCICDIVGEVYGYAYPRLFIWVGVLAEFVFSSVVIGVSHLTSPHYIHNPDAYPIVFDPTIRYVFSSLAGLLVGEFANVYFLAKWKIFLAGKYFIFRSLVATAFGQACLTVIVDILNYYDKVSINNLVLMMFSGYLWKMSFAVILVFPSWMLVKFLKKVENIDFYDVNTNFNPFVLSLENEKRDEFKSRAIENKFYKKMSF